MLLRQVSPENARSPIVVTGTPLIELGTVTAASEKQLNPVMVIFPL
jgi:hypothetical protein